MHQTVEWLQTFKRDKIHRSGLKKPWRRSILQSTEWASRRFEKPRNKTTILRYSKRHHRNWDHEVPAWQQQFAHRSNAVPADPALLVYLHLCLDPSCSPRLNAFLCELFNDKKRPPATSSVSKSPLPFLSAPAGYFYPLPPPTLLPPPIHPSLSRRTLCANLYSLSHAKHLSCPHWMSLQSNQHLSSCKAF